MVTKKLSRKRFITASLTGIAGLRFMNSPLNNESEESSGAGLRNVGSTGIRVTPVCFGASRTSEESLVRYTIDKGINFIDTGRAYSNGNNERIVGRAVGVKREKVVIQSKIRLEANELPTKGKGKKGGDEIRKALSSKLEASLKALNTNYIDILLYHDAADESLLFHQETMKFFSDAKQAGTIRAHGFSTHNDRMNLTSRNNAEKFYDVIMVPFNHAGSFVHSVTGNYSEWDHPKLIKILEEALKKGTGVIAMKTCSGGKYTPAPSAEASYKEAVKWVITKDFICSAAIAMASFEQVDEYIPLLQSI